MRFAVLSIAFVLLVACSPKERAYAPPAPSAMVAEPMTPPPSRDVIVGGAPTIGVPLPPPPCSCEPLGCFGEPLVSGGASGCEPTIGTDTIGSVHVRMPGGETFVVWIDGEP